MRNQMKSNKSMLIIGVVLGLAVAFTITILLGITAPNDLSALNETVKPKPMYWVAPMDANYKRDE